MDEEAHTGVSRRRYLLSSACGVAMFAGCLTGDWSDNENDSEQKIVRQMGEQAVFSAGEEELEFRPRNIEISNLLMGDWNGRVRINEADDGNGFLVVEADIRNTGEEQTRFPRHVYMIIDGSQYESERTVTRRVFDDDSYTEYYYLQPGVSETVYIVFEIPVSGNDATLQAEWETTDWVTPDTVTAEWTVQLDNIQRNEHDFTDFEPGDEAVIGTEDIRYEIAVTDVELTDSYTYEDSSGEQKKEAKSGKHWVLITVRAENSGNSTVRVPSPFNIDLVSDGQQFDRKFYRGDDDYGGGDLPPEVTDEGRLLFEVPDDVSSAEVRIEFTDETDGVWAF